MNIPTSTSTKILCSGEASELLTGLAVYRNNGSRFDYPAAE